MNSQKSTNLEGVYSGIEREVGELMDLSVEVEELDGGKTRKYDISQSSGKVVWNIFGYAIPKQEVVYFSQIVILYIVIVIGLINITTQNGDSNIWTPIISGSIGYLLPNPSIKKETIILKQKKKALF